MLLVTTWFGSFLCEGNEVKSSKTFPKDANEISKRLKVVGNLEILDEEKQLVANSTDFFVLDPRLEDLGGTLIEEDIPNLNPEDFGYKNHLLHEAMMNLAEEQTKQEASPHERITQAVNALDDLIQSSNLLSERLHEWWGMQYPKQGKLMKEEDFVAFVLSKEADTGVNEEDLAPILDLARTLNEMYNKKEKLEEYIKVKMEASAFNISHLVGPIIGARLIAKAGSLERLAKLPSGTIQVLGAEKALFRHLKEGSNPPKHGFIFQHPLVHRAPYWQRGKISRAFAAKIAIAAKMDQHSDKKIGEELKNEFLERIQEIKERYPKPVKKGKRKSR
jgi:nucleolar protein 56